MERSRRIASLWSYLPAFRVVAELEHLPSASAALHVSPSALSRTIKLLEHDVGTPLFDRVGRRLQLNAAGREMLRSVRFAMRMMDEGLQAATTPGLHGPVHISCPGPLAPVFVFGAVEALAVEHAGLTVHLQPCPSDQVIPMLRKGALDLALLDDPLLDADVEVHPLTELTHGVYCAPGHPLAWTGDSNAVRGAVFVAPAPDDAGATPDAWPEHEPRRVGLRVSRMQVAVDACRRGTFVCAMPDVVGENAGLVRLPCGVELARTTLCLAHRLGLDAPEVNRRSRTGIVADAIRALI
jgi:DNA-binding transcriptional LysR family regulator